jgi:neurotrimin
MIWIPNQLIGAPIGSDVKLECHTESSPRAIAYWVFNETMVLNTARHRTEEQHHSNYKLDSRLLIKNLQREDFGNYKCLSKNSLGENEGSIMIYGKNQRQETLDLPYLTLLCDNLKK